MGEGWHNYHHTYPWDYRASELGQKFNLSTILLDAAAKVGWAYDLRSATSDMVLHRILKKGDGTHPKWSKLSEQEKHTQLEAVERRLLRKPGQ